MLKEVFSSKHVKQKWRWQRKTLPVRSAEIEVPTLEPLEPSSIKEAEKLSSKVRIVWSVVLRFLSVFVGGDRMVRLVAPGVRPLESYEFENRAHFDLRQFGGGSF